MAAGKTYLGLRGERLNFAIAFIAGMDFLLFGYDQGVMGGILTLPSFLAQFPDLNVSSPPDNRTPNQAATIQGISVASYNLGCFLGAIFTIFIGNYLGRRKTIFTGSCIMIVGAALMCSAFSLGQFIAGRLITGIGNGLNTSTVPTWQSETSKSHKRGMLVMIEGSLITGGIMLSYWTDFGFSFLEPSSVAWRFPLAFQIVFALVIVFLILPLPESPRWLVLKGRDDEALEVLCALNAADKTDPYIVSEFEAIEKAVAVEVTGGFRDLFTMGPDRNFHRVVLAYVNQMFQQISGINLITYYAATIYQGIGLDDLLSRLLAACNGTEYFMASWVAIFTIERFGRRSLMLVGAIGMSVSMCFLAGFTSVPGNNGLGVVAAVFLFVFNTFFAIGWLGMTWLYPAEIVPLRIRAPANALATSANWIFNFLVVMITPISFNNIGYQTYIIFAVINAFIAPCVYFFYPETAYRSLEEMDDIFEKCTPGWKGAFEVVKIARDEPRRYGKHGELLLSRELDEEATLREKTPSKEKHTGGDSASEDV